MAHMHSARVASFFFMVCLLGEMCGMQCATGYAPEMDARKKTARRGDARGGWDGGKETGRRGAQAGASSASVLCCALYRRLS